MVTVLLATGCGDKKESGGQATDTATKHEARDAPQDEAPPEPACEEIGSHLSNLPDETLKLIVSPILAFCDKDSWPAAAKRCFMTVKTISDMEKCSEQIPQPLETVCLATASAWCSRFTGCAMLNPTIRKMATEEGLTTECKVNLVGHCCEDAGRCDERVIAQVSQCEDEIEKLSCSEVLKADPITSKGGGHVKDGDLPESCRLTK